MTPCLAFQARHPIESSAFESGFFARVQSESAVAVMLTELSGWAKVEFYLKWSSTDAKDPRFSSTLDVPPVDGR